MKTLVKFGLSEKHTKFEKIFLMLLTNQLIYLVNVKTMRKIFSNYVCFSKRPNLLITYCGMTAKPAWWLLVECLPSMSLKMKSSFSNILCGGLAYVFALYSYLIFAQLSTWGIECFQKMSCHYYISGSLSVRFGKEEGGFWFCDILS